MTDSEVDSFFADGDNIALACGPVSGLMVIDLDDYKKKTEVALPPIPLRATTPRGGTHGFFKYKEGSANTVNRELATDIRSKGGYVLIAPSIVRYEDGTQGTYQWNVPPQKWLLERLPELPEALAEKVYSGSTSSPIEERIFGPQNHPGQAKGSIFDTGVDSGSLILSGERNTRLHKYAMQVFNSHPFDEAELIVHSFNLNNVKPPLPRREVELIVKSAKKRVSDHPSPTSQRIKDELRFPSSILSQPPNQRREFERSSIERAMDFFTTEKSLGLPTGFRHLDSIIGGLIPGQTYLLFADTNVGKSVFCVNILVNLAKNGIKCTYFDLENNVDMSVERIACSFHDGKMNIREWQKLLREGRHDEMKELILPVGAILDKNLELWDVGRLLDKYGGISWLDVRGCIEEAAKNGSKAVFVDHLHFFDGAETDHAILANISKEASQLASGYNISLFFVAHTKKGLTYQKDGEVHATRPTVDSVLGSGLITKHFKNVIALRRGVSSSSLRERIITTVYVDKTKYGPAGHFPLEYDEDTIRFVEPGVFSPLQRLNRRPIQDDTPVQELEKAEPTAESSCESRGGSLSVADEIIVDSPVAMGDSSELESDALSSEPAGHAVGFRQIGTLSRVSSEAPADSTDFIPSPGVVIIPGNPPRKVFQATLPDGRVVTPDDYEYWTKGVGI